MNAEVCPQDGSGIDRDLADVHASGVIGSVIEQVRAVTGMGFVAVARVTFALDRLGGS